ncbi:MAG: hypothetical protein A2162_05445 [Deltaproteobacteria bacterium RBG_13_52_11b]|nr:MAG: hypothetical protein A2162_05445 [Deltaproteobacteria bacterium RBG_13_52_11b]
MRVLAAIIIWCLITEMRLAGGSPDLSAHDQNKVSAIEEVRIAGNALVMPMGRIVLVRNGSQYCAVKFTRAWTGKTDHDYFARYESYYQGDGTGDFSKPNVQFTEEELAWRRRVGLGKFFSFPAGPENLEIKCGPIRLFWSSKGSIYFRSHAKKDADYGIELAPTTWTEISEVNIFDPRLQWYSYDGKRKEVRIPIDRLWENHERENR